MNTLAAKPTDSDQILAFCKASADALRLDILRVLNMESFGVLELCLIFEMPQPGMSHHLKILATAGLLSTRREGNSIFYRRALIASHHPLEGLTTSLFVSIDACPLPTNIAARVASVHKDRGQSSIQFFEKNADRFKENQDLIAEFSHYSGCVQDLLSNEDLNEKTNVIEIGPGDSPLLNILAGRFSSISALDNTEEMLTKAKSTLASKYTKKVNFVLGDLEDIDHRTDLLVLNMVLHHMPSPSNFFKTAADRLTKDGRLLIIDLCSHNQDWAREICGDLWLGFEPSDLDRWAREANFRNGQSAYLGLKNGFQVQVRLFHKPTN